MSLERIMTKYISEKNKNIIGNNHEITEKDSLVSLIPAMPRQCQDRAV